MDNQKTGTCAPVKKKKSWKKEQYFTCYLCKTCFEIAYFKDLIWFLIPYVFLNFFDLYRG